MCRTAAIKVSRKRVAWQIFEKAIVQQERAFPGPR